MIELPKIAGINYDDVDNIILPEKCDTKQMFDFFAMSLQSQFTMIVKGYNMAHIISGKKFPFPMKLYFNKAERFYIMGTEFPEFANRKMDYSDENKKAFIPFFMLCKLVEEENWFSLIIESIDKATFTFSNKQVFKYGY